MTVSDLIDLLKTLPGHLTVVACSPMDDNFTELSAEGVNRESNYDFYTGGGKAAGGQWRNGECVAIAGR